LKYQIVLFFEKAVVLARVARGIEASSSCCDSRF